MSMTEFFYRVVQWRWYRDTINQFSSWGLVSCIWTLRSIFKCSKNSQKLCTCTFIFLNTLHNEDPSAQERILNLSRNIRNYMPLVVLGYPSTMQW